MEDNAKPCPVLSEPSTGAWADAKRPNRRAPTLITREQRVVAVEQWASSTSATRPIEAILESIRSTSIVHDVPK
ncbi:hypothetical protein ACLOJK_028826 [Asimina triloba]